MTALAVVAVVVVVLGEVLMVRLGREMEPFTTRAPRYNETRCAHSSSLPSLR